MRNLCNLRNLIAGRAPEWESGVRNRRILRNLTARPSAPSGHWRAQPAQHSKSFLAEKIVWQFYFTNHIPTHASGREVAHDAQVAQAVVTNGDT